LKSVLNAKNKNIAFGALTIPVFRYNFGVINWTVEEIRKIYKKTRVIDTV
jgi:hypothetical protein